MYIIRPTKMIPFLVSLEGNQFYCAKNSALSVFLVQVLVSRYGYPAPCSNQGLFAFTISSLIIFLATNNTKSNVMVLGQ